MVATLNESEQKETRNHPVLVLNRSWQPVGVTSLKRAVKLASSEYVCGMPKARIIECDNNTFQPLTWEDWSRLRPKNGDPHIQGVDLIFRIPEVIVLSKYDGQPVRKVTFSRRMLYKRDNFSCQYCGIRPGSSELTTDHVLPRSQGGKTTWENCVAACVKCNGKKANRTPEQARMKLLTEPKRPKYNLLKGDYRVKSWEQFLGATYWMIELENDNEY